MTGVTATFSDLEEWADMGVLGVDVQVYDLTRVTEFLSEMAEAATDADAPMFGAGLVPADRCVILLSDFVNGGGFVPVYLERLGGDKIRCNFLAAMAHNEVLRKMTDSAEAVANMLATGADTVPEYVQRNIDWLDQNGWLDPSHVQNQIMQDYIFEIGKPIEPTMLRTRVVIGGMMSAACEFMAMPIAARTPTLLPRPMRRRLERTGKSVRLTNVSVTRSVAAGLARSGGHGEAGGRALHFCSGHWRISPNSIHAQPIHGQMKIWIDGCWKGNPEHGVVLHRYLARKRSAA